MLPFYFTLGQRHRHVVNGVVFDKDSVARIYAQNSGEARAKAFEIFGDKFCFQYSQAEFNSGNKKSPPMISYFPRGVIDLPETDVAPEPAAG